MPPYDKQLTELQRSRFRLTLGTKYDRRLFRVTPAARAQMDRKGAGHGVNITAR